MAVKIDAEGAEVEMLESASAAALAAIGEIALEYHDSIVPDARARCEAVLTRAGFVCRSMAFSHDQGILIARPHVGQATDGQPVGPKPNRPITPIAMAELRLARPRVLFFVEGNTDIRFVVGLSEICDLTMAVPARAYEESALKARVAASGARLRVHEIAGGRAAFQLRSLAYLWRAVPAFDVVLVAGDASRLAERDGRRRTPRRPRRHDDGAASGRVLPMPA